jgi:hypothetical protein
MGRDLDDLEDFISGLVESLLPAIHGVPFEAWFRCFHGIDYEIDYIRAFVVPEEAADPKNLLERAKFVLGHASDAAKELDNGFLSQAAAKDGGCVAAREGLVALIQKIDALRDRITRGEVAADGLMPALSGIESLKLAIIDALPPVLGVAVVEWYKPLYEIGYRLWEVGYRATTVPGTIDRAKAISLLRSAKAAKESLEGTIASRNGLANPCPNGRALVKAEPNYACDELRAVVQDLLRQGLCVTVTPDPGGVPEPSADRLLGMV